MPANSEVRAVQAISEMRVAAGEYLKVLERAEDASVGREVWLEFAAELGGLSARLRDGLNEANKGLGITSAREAILLYLRRHVGEPVPADHLAGVSGIVEWARRVRELRVEFGWPVESGVTRDDLPYDHYRLTADEPDEDLADRWRVAVEARNLKKPGGKEAAGRARLLHYLKAISPGPPIRSSSPTLPRSRSGRVVCASWKRRAGRLSPTSMIQRSRQVRTGSPLWRSDRHASARRSSFATRSSTGTSAPARTAGGLQRWVSRYRFITFCQSTGAVRTTKGI